jgi:uncharacterized protein YycO
MTMNEHKSIPIKFSSDRPIPIATREYGKIVNPSLLEAGDLMLICNKRPEWISIQIQKYQEKIYNREHAKWHHAVVSGGGVEVCEATISGVCTREFWPYMNGENEIRIRRIRGASKADRAKVAYYAASQAGSNYSLFNLFKTWQSLYSWNFLKKSIINSKGFICSQLYFEACMRIGVLLTPGISYDLATPSHLSASSQLEDIEVEFVDIQ